MSGVVRPKTPLQIAQEKITQLTNETSRLKGMSTNLQRQIANQTANSQKRIRDLQNKVEKRDSGFLSSITGLRSNLKSSEKKYRNALKQQSEKFYASQAASKAEFNNKLKNQAGWTKEQIGNERRARIEAINQERIQRVQALERQRQWTEREIAKERARTDKAIANERSERIRALQKEREMTNRQIKALDKEINSRIDAERTLTNAQIDNLKAFTEAQLDQQRAEYHRIAAEKQQQIDAIRSDVESIFEQEDNQRETAQDYLTDLGEIIQEINENLPHQKFAPGELQRVTRKVEQAAVHIGGAPQAAIANAQEAYFDLVEIREKVVEKEAEFNMWHTNVLETLNALNTIINENREIEIEGVSQEANLWTFGKYEKFEEKVKNILSKVEVDADELSLEDLKEIHDSIEELRKEHEELIKEALTQIMSSHIRYEIADSTAAALAKEDYEVVEGDYEGEDGEPDPRKAYVVKLSNGRHEIVVVVNPESPTSNSLLLNSQDSTYKNPEVALERMKEVARMIQEDKGIEVSMPECADIDHRVDDLYGPAFKEIYKKGIPKKVRDQLGINNPLENNRENG